jgi:transcriptional regulator with XRE-family HTH domain
MDVGQNIKNLRELKNYSQSAMAKMLDVSQKTYSNIETSGNKISIELIEKIATILNVSFNKILELNSEAILNNTNQTGGISQLNTATTTNNLSEKNNELFEKLIIEKDERIKTQKELILTLKQSITDLRGK